MRHWKAPIGSAEMLEAVKKTKKIQQVSMHSLSNQSIRTLHTLQIYFDMILYGVPSYLPEISHLIQLDSPYILFEKYATREIFGDHSKTDVLFYSSIF